MSDFREDYAVVCDELERERERRITAESKLYEALHAADGKRWNMHRSGDGKLQVCFGNHERGAACQYVTFVQSSRLDALQQKFDELTDWKKISWELNEKLKAAENRLGTLEETITVSGQSPVVDVQNTTQLRTMTRTTIDELPDAVGLRTAMLVPVALLVVVALIYVARWRQ